VKANDARRIALALLGTTDNAKALELIRVSINRIHLRYGRVEYEVLHWSDDIDLDDAPILALAMWDETRSKKAEISEADESANRRR
jgi:hypothetical protein